MDNPISASVGGKGHGAAGSYIYIALATILFSSMEIALKTIAGRFNPIELNFLRFTIGGLFLLPFALRSIKKRGAAIEGRDWGFFALSGFACVVVSMTLYQLAIQYCKASIVAILFSCNPVFALSLAALFLKERIRGFNIATMLASLAGMVCIVNPLHGGTEVGGVGIALAVGAAVAFAVYSVMGKPRSARMGGVATTAFSFLFGSLELVVLILLSRIPGIARGIESAGLGEFSNIPFFAGLTPDILPIFAYISLCVTGVGFASYFLAIEKTSAASAAMVFYIKPALAPLLALAILKESIAPTTAAGIVLIAAGSAITFVGQQRVIGAKLR
jgi:drug/metabolite transporter (DMT)-like permease